MNPTLFVILYLIAGIAAGALNGLRKQNYECPGLALAGFIIFWPAVLIFLALCVTVYVLQLAALKLGYRIAPAYQGYW